MFWRSSGMRITMAVMAVFMAASAVILSVVFWRTNQILTERDVAAVIAETRALSTVAARDGTEALLARLRERSHDTALYFGLVDAAGRQRWLSGLASWPVVLEQDNKTAVFDYQRRGPIAAAEPSHNQRARVAIGATLLLPDGARLLVARDVTEHREYATEVRIWFASGLALLVVLAVAAGWLINRLLMARIDGITQTANKIMSGDLQQRVPLTKSQDEFDALADNLNGMLDRIEDLMRGLREVSDNIAHDLKTPLNRLRIRAEEALRDPRGDAACREGLETTLVEADELIRTFNALLRVARLEAGSLGNNIETFDVAELIRDLAEFYEPVAEEAGAVLRVQADQAVYLSADRQLISQALTNLLENALKYGLNDNGPSERRQITLGVALSAAGGGASLSVADCGAGIAQGDTERVLKRFVRLDAARSKPGTGLGLSLVAAVVRQHGGTIELVDNSPGLKVVLRIPPTRVTLAPEEDQAPTSPVKPAKRPKEAVKT